MKVLSNSNNIIRQIGTHKTQCVHRIQLQLFVPHDEIKDLQVNQMEFYPDANAVEVDIFDKNQPGTQKDTSDEEAEKETIEINHPTESPTFSNVCAPEVIARRTSMKHDTFLDRHRQTLTITQHPPNERNEDHVERVPCTLVPESDQMYRKDSHIVSHNNARRMTNTQAQTIITTRTSRSTETRYKIQASPTPKKLTEFLIHQIGETRETLRPIGTQGDGTKTYSSQQHTSSENIRDSEEVAHGQHNSQHEP